MATTVLTSAASVYAVGYRHAHYHLRASTPDSGDVRDGIGEWAVFRNGSLLSSSYKIGVLDYAWILQPNDVVVVRFTDAAGNKGAWVHHDEFAVAGTSDYDVWVDTSGSNGAAGTQAAPVATLAEAVSRCNTNSPTGVRTIYLRAGQTHAAAVGVLPGQNTSVRLTRIVRYGDGARPIITTPGNVNGSMFSVGRSEGLHFIGIDINAQQVGAPTQIEVIAANRSSTGTIQPLNVMLLDCVVRNCYAVLNINDSSVTAENRNDGRMDWLAIVDSEIRDYTGYALISGSPAHHWTYQRTSFGADTDAVEALANTIRMSRAQDCYFADLTLTPVTGASWRFGVGPALSGSPLDGMDRVSIADVTFNGGPSGSSFSFSDDGLNSGNVGYLGHVRMVRCRGNRAPVVLRHNNNVERLQIWDSVFFNEWGASCVEIAVDGAATINKIQFRNSAFRSGNAISVFSAAARFADDSLEFDSCLHLSSGGTNETRNFISFQFTSVTGSELIRIIGYSNCNVFAHTGSSTPHYAFIDDPNDWLWSLSDWQTNSPWDANSVSVSNSTLNWINSGDPANGWTSGNVRMANGTGPQNNIGRPRPYSIDADGRVRSSSTPDAGPFEFGATTLPDTPLPPVPVPASTFSAHNEHGTARTETICASIPFPEGVYPPSSLQGLVVTGFETAWMPMQYWPDGSIKIAQAQFTDQLNSGQKKTYTLSSGIALSAQFSPHPWLAEIDPSYVIGAEVRDTFNVPYRAFISGAGTTLQSTALKRVRRFRVYHTPVAGQTGIGRDFLASRFYITEFRDMPFVVVDWVLGNDYLGADNIPGGNTDPNLRPLGAVDVVSARLLTQNATWVLRYRPSQDSINEPESFDGFLSCRVMQNTYIGDGQTRRYRFLMRFERPSAPAGEKQLWQETASAIVGRPLYALASLQSWQESAAAGLLGGPITGPADSFTRAKNEFNSWNNTNHFGTWGSRGDPKVAGTTGTPRNAPLGPDFSRAVQGECHEMVQKLEQLAWAQAMRPYHLWDLVVGDEQQISLWSGTPFLVVPGESLGRRALRDNDPYPQYRTLTASPPNGWEPYTIDHWTSDLVFDYWNLTGDAWAKDELRQLGQNLKGTQRLINDYTATVHSARAEGWCLQSFVQVYQATQDENLRQYAMRRVNEVIDVQRKKNHPAKAIAYTSNFPATTWPLNHEFMMPWQHGPILYGFLGAYRAFGNPILLTIAEDVVAGVEYSWVTNMAHPTFGFIAQGLRYYTPVTHNGVPIPPDYWDNLPGGARFGDSPLGGAHIFLIGGLHILADTTSNPTIRQKALQYGSVLRGDVGPDERWSKWYSVLPEAYVSNDYAFLGGQAAGSSSATASVRRTRRPSGQAPGLGYATANVRRTRRLALSVAGNSSSTGTMDVPAPTVPNLLIGKIRTRSGKRFTSPADTLSIDVDVFPNPGDTVRHVVFQIFSLGVETAQQVNAKTLRFPNYSTDSPLPGAITGMAAKFCYGITVAASDLPPGWAEVVVQVQSANSQQRQNLGSVWILNDSDGNDRRGSTKTIYANGTTGSDSNPGTALAPVKTLSRAAVLAAANPAGSTSSLADMNAGGAVVICEGTFIGANATSGSLIVGNWHTRNEWLTFQAGPAGAAFITTDPSVDPPDYIRTAGPVGAGSSDARIRFVGDWDWRGTLHLEPVQSSGCRMSAWADHGVKIHSRYWDPSKPWSVRYREDQVDFCYIVPVNGAPLGDIFLSCVTYEGVCNGPSNVTDFQDVLIKNWMGIAIQTSGPRTSTSGCSAHIVGQRYTSSDIRGFVDTIGGTNFSLSLPSEGTLRITATSPVFQTNHPTEQVDFTTLQEIIGVPVWQVRLSSFGENDGYFPVTAAGPDWVEVESPGAVPGTAPAGARIQTWGVPPFPSYSAPLENHRWNDIVHPDVIWIASITGSIFCDISCQDLRGTQFLFGSSSAITRCVFHNITGGGFGGRSDFSTAALEGCVLNAISTNGAIDFSLNVENTQFTNSLYQSSNNTPANGSNGNLVGSNWNISQLGQGFSGNPDVSPYHMAALPPLDVGGEDYSFVSGPFFWSPGSASPPIGALFNTALGNWTIGQNQSTTGQASGTSSASAALRRIRRPIASVSGLAAATGMLGSRKAMSAIRSGSSTATANALILSIAPATAIAGGTSSASATILRQRLLAAAAAGVGSSSATIQTPGILLLAGAAAGAGYVLADLQIFKPIGAPPAVIERALLKQRIHNGIAEHVRKGPFFRCVYDPRTGKMLIDPDKPVTPTGITVKELSSTFQPARNYRRSSFAFEMATWNWVARVEFDAEIATELFEARVLEAGIRIPPLAGVQSQPIAVAALTGCEYAHPPEQSPSKGTLVNFLFEVQTQLLRK